MLAALIKRQGQSFEYEYDFGDGWKHRIEVEQILPFDPDLPLPVCLAGERACPPEDCGGVSGYFRVLEALRHPNDPALRALKEWMGGFDPEKFQFANSFSSGGRCADSHSRVLPDCEAGADGAI